MKNQDLTLSHPIDRLELYGMDPQEWDCLMKQADLFLVDDFAEIPLVPYMRWLWLVEVKRTDRVECLPNGQYRYFLKLPDKPNDLWEAFFHKHGGKFELALEGDTISVRCQEGGLQEAFEEICHRVSRATRDYSEERRKLVWRIFEKMRQKDRREKTEAEIQAEMQDYRKKRQERTLLAEQNRWSVPILIQGLNQQYREVLENKFVWWSRILDDAAIRKYRGLFELELLIE